MRINSVEHGAIIIAGSGMCTGGRIRHHLKHNVWLENCHLVIAGFQAQGTLGRRLVEGASHVRLWNETICVAARIHTIGGLSAHADQSDLLRWYGAFRSRPPVCLVHGEALERQALAAALRRDHGVSAKLPESGESMELGRPPQPATRTRLRGERGVRREHPAAGGGDPLASGSETDRTLSPSRGPEPTQFTLACFRNVTALQRRAIDGCYHSRARPSPDRLWRLAARGLGSVRAAPWGATVVCRYPY